MCFYSIAFLRWVLDGEPDVYELIVLREKVCSGVGKSSSSKSGPQQMPSPKMVKGDRSSADRQVARAPHCLERESQAVSNPFHWPQATVIFEHAIDFLTAS